MAGSYICKIASIQEMNTKWEYEISHSENDKENWIIWKNKKNNEIYAHYGFTEYIKSGKEFYPDGTAIDVEYYEKLLK